MHPEIDRFAHLGSPLHRWDPRWKLASLFLLAASFAAERPGLRERPEWARDLPPALVALGFAAALVALSRIPFGFILWRLRGIAAFLLAVLLIVPWTWGAEGWAPAFSQAGVLAALLMVARAFAIVLVTVLAFATSPFDRSMKALRALRMPAPLVQVVLFAYRYLFVYLDQLRRLGIAMRSRGFRARTDLRTLRVLGNGIGVLLVGSFERTARIQGAMVCRGFDGTFRTLDELRTRPSDVVLAAAVLSSGALLAAWRIW
ncbi:MAG: cobalt ECF transporter T component CbiQ [Planctomycetes bacterium]|nr:cobalt ECF transporter T component CbiQ [Planctomycetota bacterium]